MIDADKFSKIIALMNSTTHPGEKEAARACASNLASLAGMTLDQAIEAIERPKPQPFMNIMSGWDDWMEQKQPGHKARRAAEKVQKAADHRERLDALLARYGSIDAILAPCEKEQLLREVLAPWITYCESPGERWTLSADGYSDIYSIEEMPSRVRTAISGAYPLPTTFAEAKAEFDYWTDRERDMKDALDDQHGDLVMDRLAIWRWEIVRELLETELRLTSLKDIFARFVHHRSEQSRGAGNEATEDAIFRDLEALAEAEKHVSRPSVHPRRKPGWTAPIAEMLRLNPSLSDRRIARSCRVSPTTVGKVRASLNLQQADRIVKRGGQSYWMAING